MKLNEKLFRCRKRCGLSQEELAERLGVSRQAVSKWELGTALSELDKLKLLAKEFGVSADWLLDDTQDELQETKQGTQPPAEKHSWVEDVPGVLGRLLRRYGWLFGVYLAVGGAGILGLGALAGYRVHDGQDVHGLRRRLGFLPRDGGDGGEQPGLHHGQGVHDSGRGAPRRRHYPGDRAEAQREEIRKRCRADFKSVRRFFYQSRRRSLSLL